PQHPQHLARGSFVEVAGVIQPGPAPRFSATPSALPRPAPARGAHGAAALRDWGFDSASIEGLQQRGLGFRHEV
ncbi:MAG: CoA transferase, partial [Burkholderiales bacterium]|nr:CoA transferase [Burkholderiales bacterium]